MYPFSLPLLILFPVKPTTPEKKKKKAKFASLRLTDEKLESGNSYQALNVVLYMLLSIPYKQS